MVQDKDAKIKSIFNFKENINEVQAIQDRQESLPGNFKYKGLN